jgi:hypothetical protein
MNLDAIWHAIANPNAALLSFLTFFLGLFLGNRLALGRERRVEFNASAAPVRAWLLREIKQPANPSRWPDAIELDTFASCLSSRQRQVFQQTCAGLAEAQRSAMVQGPSGDISYPDTSSIQQFLNKLLPYTARR